MREDGYETRQVLLFHVYVRIFGLHPEQNPPFFFLEDNQSNPSIKLCPTNLKIRAKGNKILCRITVNSTSIATTLFSLLKVYKGS